MQTLVLNASYEPLAVVSVRRAVILVLTEKAVAEHVDDERVFRSASRVIPMPLVVRLLRFVRVPYRRRVPWSRRGVLERDQRRCAYCGARATTVDHVKPVSRGGESRCWLNTVAACPPCNQVKANRTPREAGMRLLVEPYEPRANTALVLALGIKASRDLPDWLSSAVAPTGVSVPAPA